MKKKKILKLCWCQNPAIGRRLKSEKEISYITSPNRHRKSICQFLSNCVNRLEYLSYKPCLILHLRPPLVNTLLLLEEIFFFLKRSAQLHLIKVNYKQMQNNRLGEASHSFVTVYFKCQLEPTYSHLSHWVWIWLRIPPTQRAF